MKFNQKLIKDLKDGKIVLKNEPKNPQAVIDIILSTGKDRPWFNGRSRYYCKETSGMMYGCDRLDLLPNIPIVPIADFLLPEPRFKVGDWVRLSSGLKKEYQVLSFEYDDDYQLYFYKLSGCKLMEAEVELIPGNINESPTKCGSEKQFEIGKCYEFSDDNEEWGKGKLLAIVDHRGKYVAGFEDMVFGFEFARPIQPKEITRWINMSSQSGNQVGKKCFETEMEARQHAPQSQNVFQVKLTGPYLITQK